MTALNQLMEGITYDTDKQIPVGKQVKILSYAPSRNAPRAGDIGCITQYWGYIHGKHRYMIQIPNLRGKHFITPDQFELI